MPQTISIDATPDQLDAVRFDHAGLVPAIAQVAEEAGLPRAARFVGSVLKRFINDDEVPWHRVLGSDGTIRVAGGTARDQAQLLRAEGVEVRRGRVDLAQCGWCP